MIKFVYSVTFGVPGEDGEELVYADYAHRRLLQSEEDYRALEEAALSHCAIRQKGAYLKCAELKRIEAA